MEATSRVPIRLEVVVVVAIVVSLVLLLLLVVVLATACMAAAAAPVLTLRCECGALPMSQLWRLSSLENGGAVSTTPRPATVWV